MTRARATERARFDKRGRRLPDTGHGCGCRLCEEANAPRYERRSDPGASSGGGGDRRVWHPLARSLARLARQI